MKLYEILEKIYETTTIEPNNENFTIFIESLTDKELENLKEFGHEIEDLAKYQLAKNRSKG